MATPTFPFFLEMSDDTGRNLSLLLRQARINGLGPTVDMALKTIIDRLRHDPITFGEPLYTLKHLKLSIHLGVVHPLAVSYGVDSQNRIVYIRYFELLLGRGQIDD